MSDVQRRSAENGIWLCQSCAKLVDNDPVRFTVAVLRTWKTRAEKAAELELQQPGRVQTHGPQLSVPTTGGGAAWLTYFSGSTKLEGRKEESQQLQSFLDTQDNFRWWLIAGPAGSGKSRLALDLCRTNEHLWDAGFLSRAETFNEWTSWQPDRPTLIVVDYVASRASTVSDMVLQLSRSAKKRQHPIRVLLLERDTSGSWWADFLREASYSESVDIATCQFALPMWLPALDDKSLWAVMTEIAEHFNMAVSPEQRRPGLAFAKKVDPLGRPLFAMISTAALLEGVSAHSKGEYLRSLMNREYARWRTVISDSVPRERTINLLSLATVLGGIPDEAELRRLLSALPSDDLFPNPYTFDEVQYKELCGSPSDSEGLPSLQPDLVGEYLILDRLYAGGGVRLATEKLLNFGWDWDAIAVAEFIRRVEEDFPRAAPSSLVSTLSCDSQKKRRVWSELVFDLLPRQYNPRDLASLQNMIGLRALAEKYTDDLIVQRNLAEAELYLGVLFLEHGQYDLARNHLDALLKRAPAGSEQYARCLNALGCVELRIGNTRKAFEDFTKVIGMRRASDETRACSLNNRADIYDGRRNFSEAIRDRGRVLKLRQTSFNRRFIAHIRRSHALRQIGRVEDALVDIEKILKSKDIVQEQKMQARLDRAALSYRRGEYSRAIRDCESVLGAFVNFPSAVPEAYLLRARCHLAEGKPQRALEGLIQVRSRNDLDRETIGEIQFWTGLALQHVGRHKEALGEFRAAKRNPGTSASTKKLAERAITELRSAKKSR